MDPAKLLWEKVHIGKWTTPRAYSKVGSLQMHHDGGYGRVFDIHIGAAGVGGNHHTACMPPVETERRK